MLSPQRLIGRIYALYIVLFIFFLLIGFTMFPPFHNAALQLGMWVMGLFISLYVLKKSISAVIAWIFVFQICFILISTWVNAIQYNDLLGFDPRDADFYRSCGEDYGDKPFMTFIIWLAAIFPTIDDWGFPTIMWLVYNFFGISWGPWVIRVLNAVVITLGAFRLYKISCYFFYKEDSKVVALLWGLMPFAVHVGANGAKENFFVFFIISFFYYLYRCSDKRSFINVLGVIVYCTLLFLFRLATGYDGILCIITLYFLNKKRIQKKFSYVLTMVIGMAILSFPLVLETLLLQRGYESDFFGDHSGAKAEDVGGIIGFIVNTISSLIGPIPCFVSSDIDKLQYITKYSFSPYVKILSSFFFYYAFIDIIKKKRFNLMPMVMFSVVNMLILIIAFFGLHVRFQWPHMPLFLILAYWGYKKYSTTKHNVPWYQLYLVSIFFLILFYNFK